MSNNKSFELPGQLHHRLNFLSKYKPPNDSDNIEALSHCYGNHKILGVIYIPQIMEIIYKFDEEFSIENKVATININDTKIELDRSEKDFYRPKKFYSAQEKVGFKFINFVKSSKIDNESILPVEEKKVEIKDFENKVDDECLVVANSDISDLSKFEDAIKMSPLKETLKKFQDMYIQMKVVDVSLLSTQKLLNIVSSKTELKANLKHSFDKLKKEHTCEITLNDKVLIGRGCGRYKKKATDEALNDFHKICVNGVNILKQIEENALSIELSSDNDSDVTLEGAEMFELPLLDRFYIRNNRNSLASSILQEAFQYFKITMQFEEQFDKMNLLINNIVLASMYIQPNSCVSKIKMKLSNFVLKNLENSKWTMMRNTSYMDQFEDSVDKGGMYEKNTEDHTKINSTTNIGGQLMIKMGWSEDAGLGISGTGMKDPIINENNGRRQGIGFNFGSSKDLKSFTNNVSKYLRKWLIEDDDDIIFDRDFDNKERAMVHRECRKLGLISKSYNNKNGDRFLVVSKNRNHQELFDWVRSKGNKTKLYTLLPPGFRHSLNVL